MDAVWNWTHAVGWVHQDVVCCAAWPNLFHGEDDVEFLFFFSGCMSDGVSATQDFASVRQCHVEHQEQENQLQWKSDGPPSARGVVRRHVSLKEKALPDRWKERAQPRNARYTCLFSLKNAVRCCLIVSSPLSSGGG